MHIRNKYHETVSITLYMPAQARKCLSLCLSMCVHFFNPQENRLKEDEDDECIFSTIIIIIAPSLPTYIISFEHTIKHPYVTTKAGI